MTDLNQDHSEAVAGLLTTYGKSKPPARATARPPVSRDKLHRRAAAYIDKADVAAEGGRNNAAFSLAGHLAAIDENGATLTESETFEYLKVWNDRNNPPLDHYELGQVLASALRNGTPPDPKPSTSPAMRAQATEAATATTEKREAHKRRFIVRTANTINDELAGWAWARRVQRGGITIYFGRPGTGKTSLFVRMAAHMIGGHPWPDGSPCKQCEVLYVKGEGTDTILRERADQAGIDPAKFHITGRMDDENGDVMIDMASDVPALIDALDAKPNIGAIFLDTFDSLFPSVRAIDNANIRRSLWPLQELAEQRNIAIIIACHTNKGSYHDPLDRLSGGRAIGAAARAVWMLGKTDPDSEVIHMASCKVNDFVPADTLGFTIRGTTPDRPGAVVWSAEDCSSVTAWDLDRPRETTKRGKADACLEWMRDQLDGGPVQVQRLKAEAERMEFGGYVLEKCRNALEVEARAAKGSVPPIYWYCLPDQIVPDFNDVNVTGSV